MAFDVQAFMTDILKDVQISDSDKQTLSTVASNPAVAKRLEESTLRQSEFSRLAQQYNEKIKQAQTYWDGLAKWKADEEARFETERQSFSSNNSGGEGNNTVDTKAFEAKLQQLAQEAVAYNNSLVTLGLKHYKEFNDILDTSELLKVASRDRVNVEIAYDRLVQPKREEVQQKDFQSQLVKAREEGAQEALKNIKIPVAEQPFINTGVPHALDKYNTPVKDAVAPEYGALAAVRAYSDNMRKGVRLSE